MANLQITPFIKISSRSSDIKKVLNREIETKLSDMFLYVPGNVYYIVDGDGNCGEYATTIVSITIDQNGTRIIHKPFKCEGNVYEDIRAISSFSGRSRFNLDD